jgi:hypothetical protein
MTTTDLEKAGLIGSQEPQADALPEEMMDQEFLDSPVGRIMQALAGLELAAKSFDARLTQMEQYVTYLLSKDPHTGPKIAELMKAERQASAQRVEKVEENVEHTK